MSCLEDCLGVKKEVFMFLIKEFMFLFVFYVFVPHICRWNESAANILSALLLLWPACENRDLIIRPHEAGFVGSPICLVSELVEATLVQQTHKSIDVIYFYL